MTSQQDIERVARALCRLHWQKMMTALSQDTWEDMHWNEHEEEAQAAIDAMQSDTIEALQAEKRTLQEAIGNAKSCMLALKSVPKHVAPGWPDGSPTLISSDTLATLDLAVVYLTVALPGKNDLSDIYDD